GYPAGGGLTAPLDGCSEIVERVGDRAVDADLEVQVRTEAQPGAAAVADDLALADARAQRGGEARLVRVARRHRAGVLDAGEVALELGALGAHRAERARLVGSRAGQADLRVDEALLGARDLVAALLDDRGELLLAALEDVQALGGRRRIGLGGAHDPDDVLV